MLRSVDLSDYTNPVVVATTELQHEARSLTVKDSTAYIADSHGLTLVDVSGSDTLQTLGSLAMAGTLSHISVDDGLAVMRTGTSDITIVDVADPANPQVISKFSITGTIRSLELQDNVIYVANDVRGLRLIDISDPHNPTEIGHYASGHKAVDVDIEGRYAYLANTGQVFVLDVGASIGGGIPAAPQQVTISRTFDPDHYLLSWLPVTTDRIGDPIEINSYEIYRRNTASGTWENIRRPNATLCDTIYD